MFNPQGITNRGVKWDRNQVLVSLYETDRVTLNRNRTYGKGSNRQNKRKILVYDPWRFYYVEGIVCPDEFSQDEVDQNYGFA